MEAATLNRVEPERARGDAARRAVSIVLGMLLLGAAGLKTHALLTDPSPGMSLFSSPRWQIAFIELEVVLGLWLLSGFSSAGAWAAAVGVFSLLAGVSFYLAILGKPSCGCFGKVAVNPWYTWAGDLIALAALWYWRPQIGFHALAHSLRMSLHRVFGGGDPSCCWCWHAICY